MKAGRVDFLPVIADSEPAKKLKSLSFQGKPRLKEMQIHMSL